MGTVVVVVVVVVVVFDAFNLTRCSVHANHIMPYNQEMLLSPSPSLFLSFIYIDLYIVVNEQ